MVADERQLAVLADDAVAEGEHAARYRRQQRGLLGAQRTNLQRLDPSRQHVAMLERLDLLALRELVHTLRMAVDGGPERLAEATGVPVMMSVGEDRMGRLAM